MSSFNQIIEIGDPVGIRFRAMEAVVDTRSTFTVVPSGVLTDLGVHSHRTMWLHKPDGRRVERDVCQTIVRVQGEQGTNMVVFGQEEDPIVLGVNTLLGLFLEVSPEGDRLVPAVGLLSSIRLIEECCR